jgi:hypothetical protein
MRVRWTELSISHEDEYSVAFVIATEWSRNINGEIYNVRIDNEYIRIFKIF